MCPHTASELGGWLRLAVEEAEAPVVIQALCMAGAGPTLVELTFPPISIPCRRWDCFLCLQGYMTGRRTAELFRYLHEGGRLVLEGCRLEEAIVRIRLPSPNPQRAEALINIATFPHPTLPVCVSQRPTCSHPHLSSSAARMGCLLSRTYHLYPWQGAVHGRMPPVKGFVGLEKLQQLGATLEVELWGVFGPAVCCNDITSCDTLVSIPGFICCSPFRKRPARFKVLQLLQFFGEKGHLYMQDKTVATLESQSAGLGAGAGDAAFAPLVMLLKSPMAADQDRVASKLAEVARRSSDNSLGLTAAGAVPLLIGLLQ